MRTTERPELAPEFWCPQCGACRTAQALLWTQTEWGDAGTPPPGTITDRVYWFWCDAGHGWAATVAA
jgi:hypothetical protein